MADEPCAHHSLSHSRYSGPPPRKGVSPSPCLRANMRVGLHVLGSRDDRQLATLGTHYILKLHQQSHDYSAGDRWRK